MFAGNARRTERSLILGCGSSNARLFLRADDPDYVYVDVTAYNVSPTLYLPPDAPQGKTFTVCTLFNGGSITLANEPTGVIVAAPGLGLAEAATTGATYKLGSGNSATFTMTRKGWHTPYVVSLAMGPGARAYGSSTVHGIAIGRDAVCNGNSVAVGGSSTTAHESVSVGYLAGDTGQHSISIGPSAKGGTDGTAVGALAKALDDSSTATTGIAIGYYSRTQRRGEFVVGADHVLVTLRSYSIFDWWRETTDATPVEIFLMGNTNSRATLLNSSAFVFNIIVIARNNADDVTASWQLLGAIKRGANAAATGIVGSVTKTVIAADAGAATWDIAATADTTNGALILTVTGESSKTIRWNARGDISEQRF